jgi:hypothetical protein
VDVEIAIAFDRHVFSPIPWAAVLHGLIVLRSTPTQALVLDRYPVTGC